MKQWQSCRAIFDFLDVEYPHQKGILIMKILIPKY